jgi:hypothetical protein
VGVVGVVGVVGEGVASAGRPLLGDGVIAGVFVVPVPAGTDGVLLVVPLPACGCDALLPAAAAAGAVGVTAEGTTAAGAELAPPSALLLTAAPDVSGPPSTAALRLMSSGIVSSPPSAIGSPW